MIRSIQVHDAALALAALRELRPESPAPVSAEALAQHLDQGPAEGYRLVGVVEGDSDAAAVIGYRVMTTLAGGRTLYLDDLSTRPLLRGQGHAARLLNCLNAQARRLECGALHLGSGAGESRFTAHRHYLRHGMNIPCHHFEKRLP